MDEQGPITTWLEYVRAFDRVYMIAKNAGQVAFSGKPGTVSPGTLLFSPHPDDEIMTGGLAFRLLRESGLRTVNLAVTYGSDQKRKKERKEELASACAFVGFETLPASEPLAFDGVNPDALQNRIGREEKIETLVRILDQQKPALVTFPHNDDLHPTHVGTHLLANEAVTRWSREQGQTVFVARTECWHPMKDPNLLLELSSIDVSLLITALTLHAGEVARNPYHLRYPARLMNNVWRGSELIEGLGKPASAIMFGELYRLDLLENGKICKPRQSMTISKNQKVSIDLLRGFFG